MASVDSTQKKRNNYKLLVDPELKKGQKKLYRLNGKDVAGVWCSLIRLVFGRDASSFTFIVSACKFHMGFMLIPTN